MRFYNQPAPILLRRRSARQDHVRLRPRRTPARPSSTQDLPAEPDAFLDAVAPFRDGLVVGVRVHVRLVLARRPLRATSSIPFVLGHALYMKAIHGGKTKNDKIDADKIAGLLRGGMLPAWPTSTPRACARPATCSAAAPSSSASAPQLIAHIQNTNSQYNLPPFAKKLTYAGNRAEPTSPTASPTRAPQLSVAADLALIDAYDEQIAALELHLIADRQGRRPGDLRLPAHRSPASARSWA